MSQANTMQVQVRKFLRPIPDCQEKEELIVAQVCANTEIAEQCFKELRKSSPTLRNMGPWSSRMLLALRVHYLNEKTCAKYKCDVSATGPVGCRWRPCRTLDCARDSVL